MARSAIRLLLLLPLLLAAAAASAQEPVFRRYTVDRGLPSQECYDVIQDRKGYIWIATDAGVARFDGYRFETFTTDDGLADNTIFRLYEDQRGRIWFGSFNGRFSYFQDDSIKQLLCNDTLQQLLSASLSKSIYVDAQDTLWIGSYNGPGPVKIAPPYTAAALQVVRNNLSSGNFYVYRITAEGHVSGMKRGPEKPAGTPQFWLGDRAGWKRGADADRWDEARFSGVTFGLSSDEKGGWWYSIADHCWRVDAQGNVLQDLRDAERRPLTVLRNCGDGLAWIARMGKGVYALGPEGARSTYLSRYSVNGILRDREGGYWFSTLEGGIFYLASTGAHYYNSSNSALPSDRWYYAATNGKTVAVTTSGDVLALLDEKSMKLFDRADRKGIEAYFADGTHGPALSRSYGKSILFFPVPEMPVPFLLSRPDRQAKLWCVTDSVGWYDRQRKKTSMIAPAPDRVISFYPEDENKVWLGTTRGLRLLSNGRLEDYSARHPALKNRIYDIESDRPGRLLLATKGAGLLVIDQGNVRQLKRSDGLISDACTSLCLDSADGSVWLGTNNGISHLVPQAGGNFRIVNYDASDGLRANNINDLCVMGGHVFAATHEGILVLRKNVQRQAVAPPVYLRGIEVNGKERAQALLADLGPKENFLTFHFIGLSYAYAGALEYKYRLDGVDDDWQFTKNTFVQYTTLPPGEYRFEVLAVTPGGAASLEPASCAIAIAPPFWKTWWFYAMLLGAFIAIVALIFRLRVRSIRRRERERTELNKRIANLNLQALQAQMNPHFLFNAINSIQNFVLKEDVDSAHKYLTRFSRLMRMVLNNSRKEFVTLEEELETIRLYVELEQLRFRARFDFIEEIDPHIDPIGLQLPPMLIQPYLENAIWHGFMQKPGRGRLLLRIEQHENVVRCIVEDNGIGRKASVALKTGNAVKHESSGMRIGEERIAVLRHVSGQVLRMRIIDKEDEQGNALGTRVEIEVPEIKYGT